MTFHTALALFLVVALLTPIAAMLGLYDTSFEQFARFAGPVIGAGSAIGFMRFFSRRT
jgi:hypothetical protein